MEKVNIDDKFAKISEYYKPHIAGELNGQMVKLVKTRGSGSCRPVPGQQRGLLHYRG
jgi:hypothetical protein